MEVLNKLGYKYSFTTKRGAWEDNSNDLLINRIPIYYHDTLPIFVNKCYGINIEDNLSFRAVISKILSLIGIKEWIKRKLKFYRNHKTRFSSSKSKHLTLFNNN